GQEKGSRLISFTHLLTGPPRPRFPSFGCLRSRKHIVLRRNAMKKRFLSPLIALVGVLAVLAAVPVAQAGVGTDSISIAFAHDEPNGAGCALDPTEVAGVVPSANWNNEMFNLGTDPNLIEDVNGVATASGAQVTWFSSNTWSSTGRGEENNNFTGV